MRLNPFQFFLFFVLLLPACTGKGQEQGKSEDDGIRLIVKSSPEHSFTVCTLNGEAVFSLNRRRASFTGNRTNFSENIQWFDFSQGLLPYNIDGKWHFFDRKGNTVKVLEERYLRIYPAGQDFYLGVKYNRHSKKSTYFFLNAKVEPAFGGEGFDQATNFDRGLAVVLKDGLVFSINREGVPQDTLSEELTNHLHQLERVKDGIFEFLIKLPKSSSNKFYYFTEYYDLEKKQIIRGSDGQYFGSKFSFVGEDLFIGDKALAKVKNTIKVFGRDGKILATTNTDNLEGIYGRNSHYLNVSNRYPNRNPKEQLKDYSFQTAYIPGFEDKDYSIFFLSEQLICISSEDKFYVCDPVSLKVLHEVPMPAILKLKGRYVLGYPVNHELYYGGIFDPDLGLITKKDSNFVFKDLNEATENKSIVTKADFDLSKMEDPSAIYALDQLKSLTLRNSPEASIDIDFGKLPNLKQLWIYGSNNFKTLPPSLKGHPSLEKLVLLSSRNLSQASIEAVVLDLPRLKELWLSNNNLSPTIRKKLKSQHPDIELTEDQDLMFDVQDLDVTDD